VKIIRGEEGKNFFHKIIMSLSTQQGDKILIRPIGIQRVRNWISVEEFVIIVKVRVRVRVMYNFINGSSDTGNANAIVI
jgi:hypothetical protein